MGDSAFQRCGHVTVTRMGKQYLVLDHASGACHAVNETAAWLLSQAASPVPDADATRQARMRYSGASESRMGQEIGAIVSRLATLGVVDRVSATAVPADPVESEAAAVPGERLRWHAPEVVCSFTSAALAEHLQDSHQGGRAGSCGHPQWSLSRGDHNGAGVPAAIRG